MQYDSVFSPSKDLEILHKHFELSQKAATLKQELAELASTFSKLSNEKASIEQDFHTELNLWQDTTNYLKKVINDSDEEKKLIIKELQELKSVSEQCSHNECMIVELKYAIEKINEEREIEKYRMNEQIEGLMQELKRIRSEKEEIVFNKTISENEIRRCKIKIIGLKEELMKMNESLEANKDEIFAWCSDRSNRRDSLRHKQKRIYTPQSAKHLKDLVLKKPCHS